MALTDDIELQREAAGTWITRKTSPAPQGLAPRHPYGHTRIQIGYLSSDFCRHAMGYLITGLFGHHDRTRFEIYGYCTSRDDGSALRQRILASFDHVLFVRDLTNEQVAECIRADEIDFLIDLNGITDGSRLAYCAGALPHCKPPISASWGRSRCRNSTMCCATTSSSRLSMRAPTAPRHAGGAVLSGE